MCFWFLLLADANNADRACVSTCSDGLLDFHMAAELV